MSDNWCGNVQHSHAFLFGYMEGRKPKPSCSLCNDTGRLLVGEWDSLPIMGQVYRPTYDPCPRCAKVVEQHRPGGP